MSKTEFLGFGLEAMPNTTNSSDNKPFESALLPAGPRLKLKLGSKSHMSDADEIRNIIRVAASDRTLVSRRFEVARLAADAFKNLGIELEVAGRLLGSDRVNGLSPGGNGSDETVAVALLLRVASELIGGCALSIENCVLMIRSSNFHFLPRS